MDQCDALFVHEGLQQLGSPCQSASPSIPRRAGGWRDVSALNPRPRADRRRWGESVRNFLRAACMRCDPVRPVRWS